MKKILRRSLSSVIYKGARFLGYQSSGIRILCYHKVNDDDSDYLTVPTRNFRDQMRFLNRRGYEVVGLSKIFKTKPASNHIVVTFDDGYQDIYKYVFPVMKEYGFKGTVFCVAEWVDRGGYLTKNQIREMSRIGFEFGSHTISHPELPGSSDTEKRKEITESKSRLEKHLEMPVDYFCYPRGLYDTESYKLVQKAKYLGACTNEPGSNYPYKDSADWDPYLMRRTEISSDDTLYDYKKKIAGAYDWLHKGLHFLRGRP